MLGRTRNKRQLDIFEVPIERFINRNHEFAIGADHIDWESLEEHFRPFYSPRGRPSIPPRKIIGMILLKERFSLSDEKVLKIWPENPYWQYFCGEVHFRTEKPFTTSELTSFRRRIGPAGIEMIRNITIKEFGNPDGKKYKSYSDRRKRNFWKRIIG
ncbi:MAG: transposase [Porphyromonadaceae bacterium]|nr:MAG: transposase [Porphyromonadaceae bacterium]